jgi:hypothetical protein
MNISRRRFMKTGMIVAATALVPLGLAKTAAAQESKDGRSGSMPDSKVLNKNRTSRLFYYNKSTFTPYVNSEFRVHLSSSKAVAITLTGIEDFSNSQEKLRAVADESFTLEFNGSSGRAFKQQTYEVEHAALGRFSLFIVPVGMPTAKGDISYEAAFNHRNQNSAATSTSSGQKLAGLLATTK